MTRAMLGETTGDVVRGELAQRRKESSPRRLGTRASVCQAGSIGRAANGSDAWRPTARLCLSCRGSASPGRARRSSDLAETLRFRDGVASVLARFLPGVKGVRGCSARGTGWSGADWRRARVRSVLAAAVSGGEAPERRVDETRSSRWRHVVGLLLLLSRDAARLSGT
jgi:hypothetical protein